MLVGLVLLITVGCVWTFTGVCMGGCGRHGVSTGALQLLSCLLLSIIYLGIIGCGVYSSMTVSSERCIWVMGIYGVVGALGYALNETMARAMERGPNGMVWGILQSGMVLPFAYGILFHDVAAHVTRLAGMLLLVVSVLMMAGSEKDKEKKTTGKSWLVLSFIAFGICGVQQTLSNEPSYDVEIREGVPVVYRCLAVALGNFIVPLVANLLRGPKQLKSLMLQNFKLRWYWGYLMLTVVLSVLTSLFLQFTAMDRMASVGMGAISYPVMVVTCIGGFSLFSCLFLHERLNLRSGLGLAFCIIGIVMVSLEPKKDEAADADSLQEKVVLMTQDKSQE